MEMELGYSEMDEELDFESLEDDDEIGGVEFGEGGDDIELEFEGVEHYEEELDDEFEDDEFEDDDELAYLREPQGLFEADWESDPDYQVIGVDTRRRILSTKKIPWRYICKLDPPGCTGTLIAPNKVLTAAHCVFNKSTGRKYSSIRVIPGKRGPGRTLSAEPFRSRTALRVNFPAKYAAARGHYSNWWPHDYAVITLNRPFPSSLGYWRVVKALSAKTLRRVRLNTAGFPGDKGGQRMYWTANRVSSVNGRKIEYQVDTFGGQSGSPVWLKWRNRRILTAIHTARDDVGTPGASAVVANRGVRITPTVLRDIRHWVRS